MSAFGDIQSMMALGSGVSAGLSVAGNSLASAVSVVPKGAGYFSGVKQQFNNYKENGSNTLGALGKTAASEMGRPFVSAYQKAREGFHDKYQGSRAKATNPFGLDTSNPFKNPHNMKYNPLRDEYSSGSKNNNFGGNEL